MNLLILILGMFISFLISMIILVKREENKEKNIIKNGNQTQGKLVRVFRKGKSVNKNRMSVSYEATYEYEVGNTKYKVPTNFEVEMEDLHTQIPKTVSIMYNPSKPKEGYVKFDSTDDLKQVSVSKGIALAICIGIGVGVILYHFLIRSVF